MKNNGFKKWIYFFLIVLGLFGSVRLYYSLTDDFRISNISYQLPFQPPWKVPLLSDEEHQQLAQILQQKFVYIGKGAQCYAFASEDHQYVLKFFKFKHLKPNFLVDLIPSFPQFYPYKQNHTERKKRKLFGVFNGHDLAFRENRKNAELIYLHLIPTNNLNLFATVIDKIGWERKINLDDVVFLIQKKGETLRTRLNQLLLEGKIQEGEKAISAIIHMYLSEYQKGIVDHDHGVMHNTGFIGDKPFHLDVGNLHKDERMLEINHFKKDLEHVIWKINLWIKVTYPQYYSHFTSFLSNEYEQITGDRLDFGTIQRSKFKKRDY